MSDLRLKDALCVPPIVSKLRCEEHWLEFLGAVLSKGFGHTARSRILKSA